MSHSEAQFSERDRKLGMDRNITRRDFLNGVAITIGGVALGGAGTAHAAGGRHTMAAPAAAATVPPTAGSYVGTLGGHSEAAMAVMHAIRDGKFWESAPAVIDSGEAYDLVVVGGGISGLAAAWLFKQERPDATVLVVENNDEFGGHARRNEFEMSNGTTLIGYGGSQTMQTPSFWSPVVHHVIDSVGIQVARFENYFDGEWEESRGLGGAVFFPASRWGTDTLVKTDGAAADWVPKTPLNDQAKADLIEFLDSPPDYLEGRTREEKLEILAATTYADFITNICGYDPELVELYQHSTEGYFGLGIDATTALDAWANWDPGFDNMDLGDVPHKLNAPSGRLALVDPDPYIYHFPDGNAGVARSLVRALVPAAMPGSTMEDLVTTDADYTKLDVDGNDVRIRVSSSVVKVAHDGPVDAAESVTVTYFANDQLTSVRAGHVVLACWHRVIPFLTDELAEEQITALNDQVKVPLLYTNVALRNWEAFDELKISGFSSKGNYFNGAHIDFPVSMGDYQFAQEPSDPIVLHLSKVPLTGDPTMSNREQANAGRRELLTAAFEDMERDIREMLAGALAGTSFDPATDIEGITVNRWSHGYALEYMRPWDQYWPDGPLPVETSRQAYGLVAIANSDAGAYAYAHSAIDQAARAVADLLGQVSYPGWATFPGPPEDLIGLAPATTSA